MVGRHYLDHEQLFKDAARITGEAGKGAVKLSVTNRAGGHNMPTGKYGDYRIVLSTQVKDEDGKIVFTKDEIFSNLQKTGITPQKTLTFEYPISVVTGKRCRVNSNLIYRVEGKPEFQVASWNGEIEGGK
jgi:mRNA-degrading endonuclease RelE of RelBE toxin-antitoxin system